MKFTCAVCLGEFLGDDSEELEKERLAELEANFPGVQKAEWLKICDECYKVMMSTMYGEGRATCH